MRTDKQIQASRANGARSRGPVTPAGKWNSAHSSRRYKILAQTLALQTEDPRQLRDLLSDLSAEFQPGTPFEYTIVEAIATARWEQQRLRTARKVAIDLQIQNEPTSHLTYPHAGAAVTSNSMYSLFASSRALDSFYREDARLERQIQHAIHTLFDVQDRRGFRPDPWSPVASGPGLTPAVPEPTREPDPASADPTPGPDDAALLGFLPPEISPACDPNNPLKTHEDAPAPIPAGVPDTPAENGVGDCPAEPPARTATASAASATPVHGDSAA